MIYTPIRYTSEYIEYYIIDDTENDEKPDIIFYVNESIAYSASA